MKKISAYIAIFALAVVLMPMQASAAGISPSGGGTKTIGQSFTVNVVASGAEFNAFQGSISVSGPVSVTAFNAGSADTWMSKPTNGGTFSGALLGRKTDSLTIASITMKGTAAGKATINVSNVVLKNGASTVGSSGGSVTYTIQKAPELPGVVTISSTTHPDQAVAYEATTIALSWNKEAGVDGFSYLLDQADGTTPAAKITDANTSANYAEKPVGVYYFHIRAHKADGWGGTSQFKITIKEPDPKINETLKKPHDLKIERLSNAVNDIEKGELTGIGISGITEPGYTANATLTPAPTLPEGQTLTAVADATGKFEIKIISPLKGGFYTLTVQGQKEKVLTPISDPISFEISLKSGGVINLITQEDIKTPVKKVEPVVKGSFLKKQYSVMTYLVTTLLLAVVLFGIVELYYFIKRKKRLFQFSNTQK